MYRAWGPPGAPGLVLLHGGAAHSRWWDHIAPMLALGRRVAAFDLSGHGDSDRREQYSSDLWAEEALAVARAAGIAGPPTLIGHSLGGFVSLRAAVLFGSEIAGAVAIDSPLRPPARRPIRPLKIYATLEEALARFRPTPDGPMLSYIADRVARASLRPVEGGWAWKFDPKIFDHNRSVSVVGRVLDCWVALLKAEYGVPQENADDVVYDKLGRQAPVIELPNSHHHAMLDEPLPLITALRTLLAHWEHSDRIALPPP